MNETKPIEPLSERVRKRLLKHFGAAKPCPSCGRSKGGKWARATELSKPIGVSAGTLVKFITGRSINSQKLDQISAWLDAQVDKDTKK